MTHVGIWRGACSSVAGGILCIEQLDGEVRVSREKKGASKGADGSPTANTEDQGEYGHVGMGLPAVSRSRSKLVSANNKGSSTSVIPADCALPVPNNEGVQIELNITTALVQRGKHAAARLYNLVFAQVR